MNPKVTLFWLIIGAMFSGCSQVEATPTPTLCYEYPIMNNSQPYCLILETGTLIQTALNQQTQLMLDDFELTIKGTLYIDSSEDEQLFAVLEGTTIIGIQGNITTINTGQQTTLQQSTVSDTIAYDINRISALPLSQLERKLNIPTPIPTIEVTATNIPDCPRPDDWTQIYQVQAGDTLTLIAQAASVSLGDIQSANCITNPNNLRVGQTLYIPQNSIAPTQPAVTFTPSVVFFRADSETLNAGSCTMLRWDVQNILELKLDNSIITDRTSQEVCPQATTSYTLTVSYFDDTQSQHRVTITVTTP